MGTNCTSFLANLFLHTYKIDFIEVKCKVGSLLNNTFRYLVLNDCKQFSRYYNSIYPNEMDLEKTNVSRIESNYLDMCIKLNNGEFSYKSYDK